MQDDDLGDLTGRRLILGTSSRSNESARPIDIPRVLAARQPRLRTAGAKMVRDAWVRTGPGRLQSV